MTTNTGRGHVTAVSWIAVLDGAQVPHQVNPRLHRVGFQNLRSAEAWVAEQIDFAGWRYEIEPLIRQRDHIATVTALEATIASQKAALIELTVENERWASDFQALQARINELESRQEQARAFLDIAAGEGMELGGVDAGDLYVKIFGYPQTDTSKEQP